MAHIYFLSGMNYIILILIEIALNVHVVDFNSCVSVVVAVEIKAVERRLLMIRLLNRIYDTFIQFLSLVRS